MLRKLRALENEPKLLGVTAAHGLGSLRSSASCLPLLSCLPLHKQVALASGVLRAEWAAGQRSKCWRQRLLHAADRRPRSKLSFSHLREVAGEL